ncbi:MAG: DUF835 domain-containing protein [Methanobacteriota archaeon]|nr:MAG: DUF835 domain-containing protein [Euryarchaeota archaeon]
MVETYELYSLLSITTSSLALSLALLVFRRFPGKRAAGTFVIAMTCFLLAALFGYEIKYGFSEQEGGNLVMWSTRFFYFVHMLAVGYTAAFVGIYFYGFQVFRRRSAGTLMNFALGAAAVLVASLVTEGRMTADGPLPNTANARLALAVISTSYGVLMLGTIGRTLYRNRDPVIRRQATLMLVGVLVHGGTAETYAYLRYIGQFPPPFLTASALFMAATFAIAILRYSMFDVTPRPEEPVAYPRKFPLRPGRAYLAMERRPDLAFRALSEAVRRGDVGLVISRLLPAAIREDFDLPSTTILSLSSAIGQNVVPPTHPEMLERLVPEFVEGQKQPVVALEGVEYLATYTGFPRVLQTLNTLRDIVTRAGGVFIVSVDGGALDEKDQATLERDFEVLRVAATEGFTVEDVFVIHSSGLLLTHAGRSAQPRPGAPDQDVMAGMLTAIMNFARVSFAEASHELKGFDLGDKKVLIERGDKVILAVVFVGRQPGSIGDEMQAFISRAERKFGLVLDRWSGSTDEVVGIRAMTARLLI